MHIHKYTVETNFCRIGSILTYSNGLVFFEENYVALYDFDVR